MMSRFWYRYYYLMWVLGHLSSFLKIRLPDTLRFAPTLMKIPFVRWLPGTRYQSNHATTPIKLSEITGALLHFKFLEDFTERVETEIKRKEHWDSASEYRRYHATIKNNPSLRLYYS